MLLTTLGLSLTSCPTRREEQTVREGHHQGCSSYLLPEAIDILEKNPVSNRYMVATNEPTLPSFCACGTNTFTVNKTKNEYSYVNEESCAPTWSDQVGRTKASAERKSFPIKLTIKGELSKDPRFPGNLRENAAVFGHSVFPLVPNYVFDIHKNASGDMDLVYTYACIGKFLRCGMYIKFVGCRTFLSCSRVVQGGSFLGNYGDH